MTPKERETDPAPLRLTDQQLNTVLVAGRSIPAEKHGDFLTRVAAALRLIGFLKVTDADIEKAIAQAIKGLVYRAPAA